VVGFSGSGFMPLWSASLSVYWSFIRRGFVSSLGVYEFWVGADFVVVFLVRVIVMGFMVGFFWFGLL